MGHRTHTEQGVSNLGDAPRMEQGYAVACSSRLKAYLYIRANPMIRINAIRTGRLNFIANAHFALVCELRTCPRMARLSALAVPPPNHKGEKRMAWFNSPERPKPSQERRQTWQDARTWFQTSHESIQESQGAGEGRGQNGRRHRKKW